QRGVRDVLTFEQNSSLLRVKKAQNQIQNSGFSAADRADEGNSFAFFYLERNTIQNFLRRRVPEDDIFKVDITVHFADSDCSGFFYDGRFSIEQLVGRDDARHQR